MSEGGVPLTTKGKTNEYNLPLEFKGVTSHAMLSYQLRLVTIVLE